jgi:REP element-mobilizing transposase RayT
MPDPLNQTKAASCPPGISEFHRTRRNLPHWEEPGSTYFLTWATASRLKLSSADRTITLNAIRHWDDVRWMVYAAVVMPDHVHALAQPMRVGDANPNEWHSLSTLLHSIKTFAAHEINKRCSRRGAVWLDERYDRVIRNEVELWEKWQYIRDNPVKARLAKTAEKYPWFYQ